MAWRRPGDKLLSEPMLVSLLAQICIARPQWVNLWQVSFTHILQSYFTGAGAIMQFPQCQRSNLGEYDSMCYMNLLRADELIVA